MRDSMRLLTVVADEAEGIQGRRQGVVLAVVGAILLVERHEGQRFLLALLELLLLQLLFFLLL